MNETKQHEKADNAPVISPLANDKTYGERWYSAVFDWGLSYWTNLTASASFSLWAEHGNTPVKLWGMKEAKSPRAMQAELSETIRHKDPFMGGFAKRIKMETENTFLKTGKTLGEATVAAEHIIQGRSMARARSVILLVPGFLVMIPAVWLGPKIKPWFVEKLNKKHYGDEAMTDPSMVARQQAIAAEARPTLLGTVVARFGTVVAAQATAQLVGSKDNFVNKIGKKRNMPGLAEFGVDPFTEKFGATMGGMLPNVVQERFSGYVRNKGLAASEAQLKSHLVDKKLIAEEFNGKLPAHLRDQAVEALKPYKTATQDLGRFIVADTFYTMVTALTIQPIVRILRHIPGMSYKPKMPAKSAQFEGEKIKVPANQYADFVETDASAQPSVQTGPQTDTPNRSINQAASQGTLQPREQQIA